MAKLKIGIIGAGRISNSHIDGYLSHDKTSIVALADPDTEGMKKVADNYKIRKTYTDPLKMLEAEKFDIVSVCTPNKFHKPYTIAALQAGAHVLCEKPMAMNAAEAKQMLKASKKAKKRLMINFSYRFTEQAWALKQQVDTGILGDIYFARTVWHRRRGMPFFGGWFGKKELAGGGPLIDLGVHRIDLALWLMGYPKPVWVMGNTYNPIASRIAREQGKEFNVEDFACGMVKFENGATLAVEASWAANCKENEHMLTQLYGSDGGLVQKNIAEGYQFEAEMYTERQGAQFDMKLHPPVPAVKSPMYHFTDCILNDKPHIATGEEGLIVMELLDAIYKSAATGEPIKLC